MSYHRGDAVILHIPENERLHGAKAVVESVEEWGCHVATQAAATGRFRAAWDEMRKPGTGKNGQAVQAKVEGFTGDLCDSCGSAKVKRCGNCLTCYECGANSGCS